MKKAIVSLLCVLLLVPCLFLCVQAAESGSVTLPAFRVSSDDLVTVDGVADESCWLLDTPVGTSRLGAVCDGSNLYLAFETTASTAKFTVNGYNTTCTLSDSPTTNRGTIAGQSGTYELMIPYSKLPLDPAPEGSARFAATIGDQSVSGTLFLNEYTLVPVNKGWDLTGADYYTALNTTNSDTTGNITVSADGTFTFKNDTADDYYRCTSTASPWTYLSDSGLMLSFCADFNDLPTTTETAKDMSNFGLFWYILSGTTRHDMAFWSDADGQIMFAAKQGSLAATRANAIPTGIYLGTDQAQDVRVRITLDLDNTITLFINGAKLGTLAACPTLSSAGQNQLTFYADHRTKTTDRVVDVTITDFSYKDLAVVDTTNTIVNAFRPSEDDKLTIDGTPGEIYWLLDTAAGASRLGALCDGYGLYLAFETAASAATFSINGVTFTCALSDSPTTTLGTITGQSGAYELQLSYSQLSLRPADGTSLPFSAVLGSDPIVGTLELSALGLDPTNTGKDLTGADYYTALNTTNSDTTGNITVSADGTFTFKNDTANSYYRCTSTASPWTALSDSGLMLSFCADFNDLPTTTDTAKDMSNFGLFWYILSGTTRHDMAFWSDADGQIMFAAKQDSLDATRANAIPTGIYLDTPQAQDVRVRITLDLDNTITLFINGAKLGTLAACPAASSGQNQLTFYADHRTKTTDRVVDVTITEFSYKDLAGVEARQLYSVGLVMFNNDDDPVAKKASAFAFNRLVTLDTTHNSLMVDQGSSKRFNRITLYDSDTISRVSHNDLGVFVSDTGAAGSWVKVNGWQLHQSGNAYTLYNLDRTARYVKVHCYLDNLNDEGDKVRFVPSFSNYLADMITVEYSPYLLGATSDFAYKGNLTVHSSSQTELYDQVVQLTLSQIGAESGQYLSSYADFRFTSGDQILPHWYDGSGTFHVRIPVVPANGSVTIIPHWGNPNAADVSDPQATLEAVYGNVSLINLSSKTYPLGNGLVGSGRAFTFPNGTVIAIARDRDSDGDTGSDTSELTAAFSYDGGHTFTKTMDLIADSHSANNAGFGSFLWDPNVGTKGRLMIFAYKVYTDYVNTDPLAADCRFVYMYTDDYGETWSNPVVLCDAGAASGVLNSGEAHLTIQNSQGRFHQLSYGDGITLKGADGTGSNVDYVLPLHFARADGTFAASTLYSKDGGKSWYTSSSEIAMSSTSDHENGITETSIAQLDDGSLYAISRAQADGNIFFYESTSTNYGVTWSTAVASDVIATNTSPVLLPYGDDRLLMWAGNTTLGTTSRRRFPMTLAISSDNYATYDRSIDLTMGTAYDTLEASIEHMTQPSLSLSPDGSEAFACWTNLRQGHTVGMLMEDFGDMIYKTKGAYDGFECTSIKGEGWLLGDHYVTGYNVHVAGNANIYTAQRNTGARSMRLEDNSASLPAYVIRQIPSMRKGTVGISLYVPSTNTSDFVFELKHAYNYTCGEYTVAGFGITPEGRVFRVNGGNNVCTVATDTWNDFVIEFDMEDTKRGIMYVNGTKVNDFQLDISSDRITAVQISEASATSTTGSLIYADDFYAMEPASTALTVETSLSVDDYVAAGTLPQESGHVFSGWYDDTDFTQPHTENSGYAYAKLTDEDVLSAKVQVTSGTTADQATTDLRLVTTVDSLYYSQVGFNITIGGSTVEASTTTVYKRISASDGSSAFEYSPNIFSSESQYFMTYTITGIPNAFFGQTITVVPYWITLNGTRVEGKELSFTINEVIGVSPIGLTSAAQGSGDSDTFENMFGSAS